VYEKDTEREWLGEPTVKTVALVAVPAAFATEILPVVAVAGTVAVIEADETTVNAATTPLKFTPVALRKFEPVIVTVAPGSAVVGENDVITGGPTVKLVALVEGVVLAGVVTWIGPVVAPVGTVAVICVAELTVFVVAAVVLNVTTVAPQKFVPVMITLVDPAVPAVGLNDVIVFNPAAVAVKALPAPVGDVPDAFVTVTFPVVAPQGTVVVMLVALTMVNVVWAWVPKVTTVTFGLLKSVPVKVIAVPGAPEAGLTPVTVGVTANAGSAVTKVAMIPIANAAPIAFLLGNLTEVPPFWSGGSFRGHVPILLIAILPCSICGYRLPGSARP
jgi:hypothetical protein